MAHNVPACIDEEQRPIRWKHLLLNPLRRRDTGDFPPLSPRRTPSEPGYFERSERLRNRQLNLIYVDPTAGGMLLQVLLGGVAGIAVIVRLFWHRIMTALHLRGRASNSEDQ